MEGRDCVRKSSARRRKRDVIGVPRVVAVVNTCQLCEHIVERAADPADRRATLVRLTAAGRRAFTAMAAEHERWIVESFGELSQREMATMASLLARLKTHVRSLEERDA